VIPPPSPGGGIEVVDVAHAYLGPPRTEVLAGVSLAVPRGGFVALIGPSGCGKSTVLRLLAGLEAPQAGAVRVEGVDVAGRPGRAALMPQRDSLLPWRRAIANATVGAELAGVPKAEARRRASALFVRFGLGGFEEAWPAQLSGGMRQRVALLRTVLAGRSALLLDEPFGALDALTRRDLQAWLAGVLHEHPRTTLLVTHDVDEALWLADAVVVLTARPARVAAVVEVGLERPRRPTDVTDPRFVARKAEVLAALDAPGPPAERAAAQAMRRSSTQSRWA
jgi:ABC-type nitrate/sulfonate/bicarbonate transport system ATPase subunit